MSNMLCIKPQAPEKAKELFSITFVNEKFRF